MKRRFGAAGAALLVLIGVAAWLGSLVTPPPQHRFPSSVAYEPEGLLALRQLLDELAIPGGLWTRPWSAISGEPATGLLIVATPLQREVVDDEVAALLAWLRRGGALLVLDDASLLERSVRLDGLLEELGLPARAAPAELDWKTLAPARPPTVKARGTPVPPSSDAFVPILLDRDAEIEERSRGVPLAVDERGTVLAAAVSAGRGRIVRVQGAPAANDRLRFGFDLAFVLALIDDLRSGGPVWFDEFHHGFGGALIGGAGLHRGALVWAGLQALVVTVLFAFARGVRFGPPAVTAEPGRRSSLEFVVSMASLYRRAGAGAHLVTGALERFARRARQSWDLGADLTIEQLGRAVAQRAAREPAPLVATLRGADAARHAPRLAEREAVRQARALARLEREVFGDDATGA